MSSGDSDSTILNVSSVVHFAFSSFYTCLWLTVVATAEVKSQPVLTASSDDVFTFFVALMHRRNLNSICVLETVF